MGLLTRPWRLGGGRPPPLDRASFLAFAEPGWAKTVLGFTLQETDGTTLVRTETRVLATDAAAHRQFMAYWAAVGWGSALTRT